MKTPNCKPCEHRIQFVYQYDFERQQWKATISYREYRQGKQYGGTVVDEYLAPKGCEYDRFMLLCRNRVKMNMTTFWT